MGRASANPQPPGENSRLPEPPARDSQTLEAFAEAESYPPRNRHRSYPAPPKRRPAPNAAELTRGEHRDTGLIEAALRHFGSWDGALLAAGFDAMEHRLAKNPYRSEESVVGEIHRRRREGLPINHRAVLLQDQRLLYSARRHFRSWDGGLRAAGFDPAEVKRAARSAGNAARRKGRKHAARRQTGDGADREGA